MNHKQIESQKISGQIQEFLAAGNQIKPIPRGVGKDNPMRTASHESAQKSAAKKRKDNSRWHGPSENSLSRFWNDGKGAAI